MKYKKASELTKGDKILIGDDLTLKVMGNTKGFATIEANGSKKKGVIIELSNGEWSQQHPDTEIALA